MRITLFLLFLFVSIFCKAQVGDVGFIKSIKYEDNNFQILFDADNGDCVTKENDLHTLVLWETSKAVRNFSFYNYGIPGNYSSQLKSSSTSLVNSILDTNFIEENDIYIPYVFAIDTSTNCDSITSICTTDTNWIDYYDYDLFYYKDHLLNNTNKTLYTLISHTKTHSWQGSSELLISHYLIKTNPYAFTNPNSGNNINLIHDYYKIPPENYDFKLFKKDENTILLLQHDNYSSVENISTMNLKIMVLDSTLQLQDSIVKQHSLFGDTFDNYFTFDFKKINSNIYLSAQHFLHYDPTKYTDYYIWKYDENFNLIDSLKFSNQYEIDNYFSNEQNRHYFYYPNDSSTEIRITNSNNDTIRAFSLPTTSKILNTNDSSFCVLEFEFFSDPYYIKAPVLYVWNKYGELRKRFPLFNLSNFSTQSYYNGQNLMYAIDSFDNIAYGYYEYESSGCLHGYLRNLQLFNLNEIYYVNGTITHDENNNCSKDTLENPVKNTLIELQLNNKSYYTSSDENGNFRITPFDTGRGKLIVHLEQQGFFTNACTDTFDVFIGDTTENPFVDILLQAPSCQLPKVSVDISTPFLRRCFDNTYTLTLTNETIDSIASAFVDITLDDDLLPVDTAFISAVALGNNSYRFYFYNLPPLSSLTKNLVVNVNCATTILGQSHCVKAVASPYNNCVAIDFPRLSADAICRNDSVVFIIKNEIGSGNIASAYRIIANDRIIQQGNLSLTTTITSQEITIDNPLGETMRFETYQTPAYPNEDTVVSIAIEACGNDTFSIGYLTLFPQDDDVPFVSIDCQQNVSSFDPNEKTAYPSGLGDSAYILPNTAVEYTIHFQNKGTFAASGVTITDTLSNALDITTFQLISSNHALSYSIIDSNILLFNFNNINLPTEQSDTMGSMGFVKFKIEPKKDIPLNTSIHNAASIIFDFNEAIVTNTVTRTIHEFLKVNVISSIRNNQHQITSTVFPNPFNQSATLSFSYKQPTTLTVLSLDGKIIQQLQSVDSYYIIDRLNSSNGLYIYELRNKHTNELLDIGKLIIQ